MENWKRLQSAMAAHGIDGLLASRSRTVVNISGARRIPLRGDDGPSPTLVLTLQGPPQLCTPDPDGALHLPADHVHAMPFDPDWLPRVLAGWLGAAADGVIALEEVSPAALARLRVALPNAQFVDAAGVLAGTDPDEHAYRNRSSSGGVRYDPAPLTAARRERIDAAQARAGIEMLVLSVPFSVRGYSGAFMAPDPRGPFTSYTPLVVVGDELLDDGPALDSPDVVDRLPASGRVGIDRVTPGLLTVLTEARPDVEFVDASMALGAIAGPKTPAELAVLHAGSLLTERAVTATLQGIRPGTTGREAADALLAHGAELGLGEPHIDPVWVTLPEHAIDFPRRGPWSDAPPWSQLTTDRRLERGDRLFLDTGFLHHGYVTDVGATFIVGRDATPDEENLALQWSEIADRVTDAMRVGNTAADLRAAALDGWTGSVPPWPYGLYVAHGIGFGTVEAPLAGTSLGPDAERAMPIQAGTVHMIEPMIYADGGGGFRAERCVHVTETGPEIWTDVPIGRLLSTGA
ncbi:MAG: peptidase family protein [Actinomycetia bacterium]|nr:peptidase family protein [Actinomycetes bacterium]